MFPSIWKGFHLYCNPDRFLSETVTQGDVDVSVVLELGEEGVRIFAKEDVCPDLEG